jgi:NADPH:quinone reductase-like Zn-dependent oxidoreductase
MSMATKTMKAFVTTGHGGLDKLEYQDVPVPTPAAGEVLIEVGACGLNNTDIWSRQGSYGTERDPNAVTGTGRKPGMFPRIQGCDVVGSIVELGLGVAESRLGERVIVNFIEYDENDAAVITGGLSSSRPGGYAEYVAVRSGNAYAIDSPLSDAELATFPCAYITAENMLDAAWVKAGETVLVPGASGGVGSALLQLLPARGARAVAVTSSAKLDQVRALEPFAAVARDEGDLIDTVRAALGRDGVEVAADVVGGPHFGAMLALLAWGGRYVTSGAIAGPVVELDMRTVYLKRLTMIGVSLGLAHHFETVLDHIRAGRIKPLLAGTYPLAELKQAQTDFLGKQFFGNLVVLPRGT